MKKSPLLCAAAAVLLASTACSRSHSVSTSEGKVSYTEKGKDSTTMTFTGKDGMKVTTDLNGGKLPADYPSDVPVYKDAKITVAQTMTEKNGRHVVMETQDPADKVTAFYKSGLETNGWKVDGTVAMGDLNMMTASKGGKQLIVQITNISDHRTITQTVSDKQ
jgi:hypothetical protein